MNPLPTPKSILKPLPTDTVIFGILFRATTETVGRCKCVCKEWYASLSAPEFEIVRRSRPILASEQRAFIIDHHSGVVHRVNFETGEHCAGTAITCPFSPNITNISVVSHLDGLLCVWVHDTHALFLWNLTTTRYNNLASSDEMGIYLDSIDTIGLYRHSKHDYRVIHISRTSHSFDTNIYSRQKASWRNIHFNARTEYIQRHYYWSPGTQCGQTVYFSVYNTLDVHQKIIVTFDINTEEVAETHFPPVASVGVLVANLITIDDKLHMFVTSGVHEMLLRVWVLKGNQWINAFSNCYTTRIPLTIWAHSTHYMSNGTCFLMSKSMKVLEVGTHNDPINCFHCVSSSCDNVSTLFLQTLVSPTI